MEPSWPRIIGVLVLVGLLLWLVFRGEIRRDRNCRLLLDLMCAALDLTREKIGSGRPFDIHKVEVGSGARLGIPVFVQFEPSGGEHSKPSATAVRLVWPRQVVSSCVSLDRLEVFEESALEKRFPWLSQPAISFGSRFIEHPWFGRCWVNGSDADVERVFNPQVRALLDQLGRNIAIVTLYDQTLKIHWRELEDDPTVVERAFQIGIDVLKNLAPVP